MKIQFDRPTIRTLLNISNKLSETLELRKYPDIMVKNRPVCDPDTIKELSAKFLPTGYNDDQRTIEALALSYGPAFARAGVIEGIVANSKVYHKGELEANPYIANIDLKRCQYDNIGIKDVTSNKYEVFYLKPYLAGPYAFDVASSIYTSDYTYTLPTLVEGDKVWMSVAPSEIETIQPHIDECSGNVLTLGCGIGYFAYMASLKPDVSSVTIVERNPLVIKIFTESILPQFQYKDKIHIIEADAVDYLLSIEDGTYDYCFADVWDGSYDIESYIPVKLAGNRFRKMKMGYWIELSMINHLSVAVFGILTSVICGNCSLSSVPITSIVASTAVGMIHKAKISTAKDADDFLHYNKFTSILRKLG